MTLISCPECQKEVSDLAEACPCCGFPVAEGIRQLVAEVTEERSAKSARQQHAAARLKDWGDRYVQPHRVQRDESDTFLDRHWKPMMVLFVGVIVVLQLLWVMSLYR
jgi:hypothetical protein